MEDIRLEVSGLYLDPNELTAPAGSLREALNVRVKRQNTVEPRPGFPITAVSGASGGGRAVFTWDGDVYGVFGTKLWHCDGSPTEVLAGSTSLAISSDADSNDAFCSDAGSSLGGLVTQLDAQNLFSLGHIAVSFGQRLLAFHHRCVGLAAQLCNHTCGNCRHISFS